MGNQDRGILIYLYIYIFNYIYQNLPICIVLYIACIYRCRCIPIASNYYLYMSKFALHYPDSIPLYAHQMLGVHHVFQYTFIISPSIINIHRIPKRYQDVKLPECMCNLYIPKLIIQQCWSGWWYTYPSEKSWSSSVGMIFHSQLFLKSFKIPCFQPPTSDY